MGTRIVGAGAGTRPITHGTPIGERPGTRRVNAAIIPREVFTNCTAITKAGQPCQARPVSGKPFCVGHMRQRASD